MPRSKNVHHELQNLTESLNRWQSCGQALAPDEVSAIYDEVRRIASRQMRRERVGHTLQPTAVANEVFLRLQDLDGVSWRDRWHFVAFATRLVRRVLVDHARERHRLKRGAGVDPVALDEVIEVARPPEADLLRVDEALEELARLDERKARIVELRFFGGLTFEEMAQHLALPPELLAREWRRAKAWLRRELAPAGART